VVYSRDDEGVDVVHQIKPPSISVGRYTESNRFMGIDFIANYVGIGALFYEGNQTSDLDGLDVTTKLA